jgi:hypothetical protein
LRIIWRPHITKFTGHSWPPLPLYSRIASLLTLIRYLCSVVPGWFTTRHSSRTALFLLSDWISIMLQFKTQFEMLFYRDVLYTFITFLLLLFNVPLGVLPFMFPRNFTSCVSGRMDASFSLIHHSGNQIVAVYFSTGYFSCTESNFFFTAERISKLEM